MPRPETAPAASTEAVDGPATVMPARARPETTAEKAA